MQQLLTELKAILEDLGEPSSYSIGNDLSADMIKDMEFKISLAREEQARTWPYLLTWLPLIY